MLQADAIGGSEIIGFPSAYWSLRLIHAVWLASPSRCRVALLPLL